MMSLFSFLQINQAQNGNWSWIFISFPITPSFYRLVDFRVKQKRKNSPVHLILPLHEELTLEGSPQENLMALIAETEEKEQTKEATLLLLLLLPFNPSSLSQKPRRFTSHCHSQIAQDYGLQYLVGWFSMYPFTSMYLPAKFLLLPMFKHLFIS